MFKYHRFSIAVVLLVFVLLQIGVSEVGSFDLDSVERHFGMLFATLSMIHGPPLLRLRGKPMIVVSFSAFALVLVSLRHWDETLGSSDVRKRKQWFFVAALLVGTAIASVFFSFHRDLTDRIHFVTLLRFAEEEANSRDILHRMLPKRVADRWTLNHVLGHEIIADPYPDVRTFLDLFFCHSAKPKQFSFV